MPERIFALFSNTPAERDRLRQAFRDAGLFGQLTRPLDDSAVLHKIELPNEEVAQRLIFAVAANGLKPPLMQRYVDATPKELAAAPLLRPRARGPGTERGHPREGTSYDDSEACPQCGAGLVQTRH